MEITLEELVNKIGLVDENGEVDIFDLFDLIQLDSVE